MGAAHFVADGHFKDRWGMDYRIRRKRSELESTGYMEIGPGKYSGAHWQDGFLFVWEDAFGMAEGILAKHLLSYDHFGMNDVPKELGLRVIAEWRMVAGKLEGLTIEDACKALNLMASYHCHLENEVAAHRDAIAGLLSTLADECERFYGESDWLCVLGM